MTLSEIKLTQFLMFSAAETESSPLWAPLTRTEMTRGANLCHMCPAKRTVSPTVARSSAQTWPRAGHYATKLAKQQKKQKNAAAQQHRKCNRKEQEDRSEGILTPAGATNPPGDAE